MKRLILYALPLCTAVLLICSCQGSADFRTPGGGLSDAQLARLRQERTLCGKDSLAAELLHRTGILEAAVPASWHGRDSIDFTYLIPSGAISDQKNTGRCWMFSGLNVLRRRMVAEHGLDDIEFSQSYLYFYDLLEKSNLFLQAMIDTRRRPLDDRMVEKLLSRPIWDGGRINGFYELVMKYGLVPRECMGDTQACVSSVEMKRLLNLKLREDALILRETPRGRAQAVKEEMMAQVYRFLTLCLGEPPTEFEWKLPCANGQETSGASGNSGAATYTPKSFYRAFFGGEDLRESHVMLMSDPGKPFGRMYEVDFDRHLYDGSNWRCLNLPMERIHELATASLAAGVPFYFTCDNDWMYDRGRGVLSLDCRDFGGLFGMDFALDRKGRILTGASISVHAMTMTGVCLDPESLRPTHYLCENSFGAEKDNGGLVTIDASWLDEYFFRMSVERRFLPDDLLVAAASKPVRLPIWDKMF